MSNKVSIFWFRRDLRFEDNVGLHYALKSSNSVLPIFIFDTNILDSLPKDDHRVSLIYDQLSKLDSILKKYNSSLKILKGNPLELWKMLLKNFSIDEVYTNIDFEPYAIKRDGEIEKLLLQSHIKFNKHLDHVIFNPNQVLKNDGSPYTVYTPFKNKWLATFNPETNLFDYKPNFTKFTRIAFEFPTRNSLGLEESPIKIKPYNFSQLEEYETTRDFPSIDSTSYLSPYLRFGMVSIRKVVGLALTKNATFLSELIWREFFIQVLYHFPKVITNNFRSKYDAIPWRNNEQEFIKWCKGETGYPLVDAGMRELNETGYMHNRVRMVTASFLCKHLLIDWKWGEAYFASKLFDFELASNNGNWQWAAGTGCDAAPYFRVFNPSMQLKKFDKQLIYTQKWVKDYNELTYPKPIVEHKMARERAISTYKLAIQ
ncbi:cryptochrome/photolyase family protein [Pseudofulvibacter geojedonensis]|uniref:Cryptochrome/photolyase family protein n=1 Tax=Pseudofulvibacter geojedonensis TaxID=1123758 RepID=A0ABW3I289_9FLAO